MSNIRIKIGLILGLIFLLGGCAGNWAGYGSFQASREATNLFDRHHVRGDCQYYVTGSYQYPAAIICLDKRYTMDDHLWLKVEMTPELLEGFVSGMQTRAAQIGRPRHLFGFDLIDKTGARIGIWYSILTATTSFSVSGNKAIIVTPELDTYEKYERDKEY